MTTYEPDGDAWRKAMTRRGGREFTGGEVCWDPADCQGICRECRAPDRHPLRDQEVS